MTKSRDGDAELELHGCKIEAAFRNGWERTRVLTERAHAEALRILDHGGWTGLDQATIESVRDGAQPGDRLPPRQPPEPYISHVTDAEVIISGSGLERRVAVLFCYDAFPGVRFGYRFDWEEDDGGYERILLKEAIETGAFDRMMRNPPAADEAGVIWADFDLV